MASRRAIDLRAFWDDSRLDISGARDLLIHVTADSPFILELSFPAVEDSALIADAIGACFDTLLSHSRQVSEEREEQLSEHWQEIYADLDPRIQVGTIWSIVDDSTTPISIFGA